MADLFTQSSAVMSDCGRYRYRLDRRWADGPIMGFVMLNPSTADAEIDDPTIRRCISFAKREGCGALTVVNLFAFRATDPKHLPPDQETAQGPMNIAHIRAVMETSEGPVVAAWGAHAFASKAASVIERHFGRRMKCLGKTKDGHPRHPLYVKGDAPLLPLVQKGPSHDKITPLWCRMCWRWCDA